MDFEKVLNYAVENNISDIHISPNLPIFFRLYGELEFVGSKIAPNDIQLISQQILSLDQQEQLLVKKSVDFAHTSKAKHRFRGNFYRTRKGLTLALRLIPDVIPEFETLGLPLSVLKDIMGLQNGLVLIVGATGHGKSTTLASVIKHRATKKAEHIITLEDPIEFLIDSDQSVIHQRALGDDIISFGHGLESALREDPDVLLVGEMRDLDTITAALAAAETGHIVFSTLHTNNAPETINRIIDAFPVDKQSQIRTQLATTLRMVVSQKLLPQANGKGRVLAYELMKVNYAIKNHIRRNSVHQINNAIQITDDAGMVLFDHSLAELLISGKITEKVAFNNAVSVGQIKSLLALHRSSVTES